MLDRAPRAARQGAAGPDRRAARGQPGGRARACASTGTRTSPSYVVWACERALERGLLPHTNLGVLDARRPGAAARGDRLAGADARVGLRALMGPSTPARRPSTRRGAWRRSAPPASCGSRSRAGSSSGSARREDERIAALEALAEVHAEHGHIQEVILQNFVPHQRYYGREPAEIADAAAQRYWRDAAIGEQPDAAAAGVGVRGHDRGHDAARRARRGG